MTRISILDSHTGGEPTRIVLSGGPDLGTGTLAERRERFAREHDDFRAAVVNEPRGSDVIVGALLVPPTDPTCVAGVIFFNNVGTLGMCGHGTIGLGVTLGHLGRIGAGTHRLETPVGVVTFEYDGANGVSLENVPSYRHSKDVQLPLTSWPDPAGDRTLAGDVAWGGNWFFLTNPAGMRLDRADDNTLNILKLIRRRLRKEGITGAKGAEIDHIELFGPPVDPRNHSRNFVLCPGNAYDRSPCGTGTSAKIACLAADGKLAPGEVWRQESIVGSVFEASYRLDEKGQVIPRIAGTAYVTAEATLLIDPADPFGFGVPR